MANLNGLVVKRWKWRKDTEKGLLKKKNLLYLAVEMDKNDEKEAGKAKNY